MASEREELALALKRATRAADQGNEQAAQDARKLAVALDNLDTQQPRVIGDESVQQAFNDPDASMADLRAGASEIPGFGESAQGMGEAGTALLTGIFATPTAGFAGAARLIRNVLSGREDAVADAAQRVGEVQERFTSQPKTEQGQRQLAGIAEPLQKFEQATKEAGGRVTDVTGSPALGTAVKTGAEMLPELLGARRPRTRPERRTRSLEEREQGIEPEPPIQPGRSPTAGAMGRRRRDIDRAEKAAGELGLDLGTLPKRQREEVFQTASDLLGGREAQGFSIEEIRPALRDARDATKKKVDKLYEEARAGDASVDAVDFVNDLDEAVSNALKTFDPDSMPPVKRAINDLKDLTRNAEQGRLSLDEIDNFRQRIENYRPANVDKKPNAALNIIKAQTDELLDAKFNSDMISGDPSAVRKWKDARKAHQRYAKTFDENDFIREVVNKEWDPTEMRRWLFGASATGFKKGATSTVKELKKVLGSESREMTMLRMDALVDVLEPLLKEDPNVNQFARKWRTMKNNNADLTNELLGPEIVNEMDTLVGIGKSAERRAPQGLTKMEQLERGGSVLAFGHGLAKQALSVAFGRRGAAAFRQLLEAKSKRDVLGEILGYDPKAPLLSKGPPAIGGVIQTGANQENAENPPTRQSR